MKKKPWTAPCAGVLLALFAAAAPWSLYRLTRPSLPDRLSAAAAACVAGTTVLCLLALALMLVFFLEAQADAGLRPELPALSAFLLLTGALLCREGGAWALVRTDLLTLALALALRGRSRWLLLAGSGVHGLSCLVLALWGPPPLASFVGGGWADLALFVLVMALLLPLRRERPGLLWTALLSCACAGGVTAAGAWAGLPAGPPLLLFCRCLWTLFALFRTLAVLLGCLRDSRARAAREGSLALRQRMIEDAYRQVRDGLGRRRALHREWKNRVTTLRLLQAKGDGKGLRRELEALDRRLDELAPPDYSGHAILNAILQSTASRAAVLEITFRASASVPEALSIPDGDLCSFFYELFDNALRAASGVSPPDPRRVECAIQVCQGYLAIRCENTYTGPLALTPEGWPLSTKGAGHGIPQMQAIAQKYGSDLDISFGSRNFIVQTALKL